MRISDGQPVPGLRMYGHMMAKDSGKAMQLIRQESRRRNQSEMQHQPCFLFSTQKDRVSPVSLFQQLQRMPMFHCHGVSTSPPKVRTTSA